MFKGNFDLTNILEAEPKKGYNLVSIFHFLKLHIHLYILTYFKTLCYREENSRNFESPISDIIIVIGEKTKKPFKINYTNNDYSIYIPKNYKPLSFCFGRPEKNRMISFKRSQITNFKTQYLYKVKFKYLERARNT